MDKKYEMDAERLQMIERMEDIENTRPSESTKQGTYEHTETAESKERIL